MEPKVGQIWKEVDPRLNRFVSIESVKPNWRRGITIRTVVNQDGVWVPAPRSRVSYADAERFNGKRGGYAIHGEQGK